MDHHELMNPEDFQPSFSLDALSGMKGNGLYVFDFHPNMLFTNAYSEEFYRSRVHPIYQDAERLLGIRHPGRGCFNLLSELLSLRGRDGFRFLTLRQAVDSFSKSQAYEVPIGAAT